MPPKKTSANIKKACLRCKGAHLIAKCKHKEIDVVKLWPDFDRIGEQCETERSEQACRAILESMNPFVDEHAKYFLEAMYQKGFNPEKPAKPAKQAKQVADDTKVPTGSDHKLASRPKKTEGSAPDDSNGKKVNTVPPPKWNLNTLYDKRPKHGSVASVTYDKAVWAECEVHRIGDHTSVSNNANIGTPTRVATNYVAVEKVPSKLYEYTVKYYSVSKRNDTGEEGGTKLADKEIEGEGKGPVGTGTEGEAEVEGKGQESPEVEGKGQDAKVEGKETGGNGKEAKSKTKVKETEVTRRSEKQRVWKALKRTAVFASRGDWATDYNTVWSLTPLRFNDQDSDPPVDHVEHIYDLVYHKASGSEATLSRVEFAFLRKLEFSDENSVASRSLINYHPHDKGASISITALNGLISKHVTDHQSHAVTQVGPNKFFLNNGYTSMGHPNNGAAPVNAHRGYYSSVRPGEQQILLNINAKTGAFFNPMPVSKSFATFKLSQFDEYGPADRILAGKSVRICYDRAQLNDKIDPNAELNRHKTIASFGTTPSQQMFSHKESGKDISVKKYYVDMLKATVPNDFDEHKCVNVGLAPRYQEFEDNSGNWVSQMHPDTVGKQLWIPAHLAELDPNQPFPYMLVPFHMESMLKAAQHHPAETQYIISKEGIDVLGLRKESGLADLGLKIVPRLLEIPATFLSSPMIGYRDGMVDGSNGTWSLGGRGQVDCKFFKAPPLHQDGLVYPLRKAVHVFDYSDHDLGDAKLNKKLTERLRNHGLQFSTSAGEGARVYGDKPIPAFDHDEDMMPFVQQHLAEWGNPDLLLIILEKKDTKDYDRVKRIFDQHLGLHTVCMTSDKFQITNGRGVAWLKEPQANVLSNLALKVNLKLKGQNHQVLQRRVPDGGISNASVSNGQGSGPKPSRANQPASPSRNEPFFADIHPNTIVIGADVTHAPSRMANCPSIASVVGNVDQEFANFPGSMRLQASRQEIIEELQDMLEERIYAYTAATRSLPKRMIFYRDGVGEDQFEIVKKQEIAAINTAFASARHRAKADNAGYTVHNQELELTFIVVGKRHNTRFFCRSDDQTNSSPTGQPSYTSEQKKQKKDRQGNLEKDPDGNLVMVHNDLRNGNPKPGLLVDSVITRPTIEGDNTFDFFLQSHEALKGTAKSGHYTVLVQGASLTKQRIKQLTLGFCYNYARATKGVSYAAPAYYADRLCARGLSYLKGYTIGKDNPDLKMTVEEKEGGKEGIKAYNKRVAEHIMETKEWCPHGLESKVRGGGKKNPWHPNFDDRMFWL